MKRRMCSMILTGILVFALSACGGDSGNKKETDQEQKQEEKQNSLMTARPRKWRMSLLY